MKKFLILSLLFVSPFTQAGLLSSIVTSGQETIKPNIEYKLNTYGFDVRVYEWTPKDNENMRCIFVAGESNSTGVACYPVGRKK